MGIKKQAVDLGYILKQIPDSNFTMDDFDSRIRLQKIIYLIQAHGPYLGYDFSWYIRGPYCSKLATTGFSLKSIYDRIEEKPKVEFVDKKVQKKFIDAKKLIKKLPNNDSLEIAASLHILKHTTNDSKEDIIDKVMKKPKKFTKIECRRIWEILEKDGLM